MSWENRNGIRVYTRSQRVNGRIVRQYVGTGELAEAIAALDAHAWVERQRQAEEWQAERAEASALDAALDHVCSLSDVLLSAELAAAGYHQHKRGEWRKRKDG